MPQVMDVSPAAHRGAVLSSMVGAAFGASGLGKLTPTRRRALVAMVVVGAPISARMLQRWLADVRREQRAIADSKAKAAEKDKGGLQEGRAPRVRVDGLFYSRLLKILKVCIPGLWSKESVLIAAQGVLLVSRTLLTDLIAVHEGSAGSAIIHNDPAKFVSYMTRFLMISLPASGVNSGMKFLQKMIELQVRERLGAFLHGMYLENRCYYQAAQIVGVTNIDQRLTEDVDKFAAALSELYNHTLKPLLDVVLFSYSLSRTMGYKTQVALYGYYFAVALVLRATSPPLSLMHAQESGLSGNLRGAHSRLVRSSEEVAYNAPPAASTEQLLLNRHLGDLVRYSGLSSYQRFLQQIGDQFLAKYGATIVALSVYGLPFFLSQRQVSVQQRSRDYIKSMRLLQNTSRGIGDLILIYKRITRLAGHTSRVAELWEEIDAMKSPENRERNFYRAKGLPDFIQEAPDRPAEVVEAKDTLKFQDVTLCSPDSTVLVRDLSFAMTTESDSVLITGPNGSGKSSLVRSLAGLWPIAKGRIFRPAKDVFFLSQRPYLVTGSLRDQLWYPHPSLALMAAARKEDAALVRKANWNRPAAAYDRDLKNILAKVELSYLLDRYALDTVVNWDETLSGGEKQRVAMARLLLHKPKFAVLDECTSAISADGEEKLYETLAASGISFLSIAHRPGVRKYHKAILSFDGSLKGSGWSLEAEKPKRNSSFTFSQK